MSDINTFTATGRLTRDPETRFLAGDKCVASLSIAVSRQFTQNNERKEETLFIDCEAWGKTAEVIGQYLKRGRQVAIVGRLKLDSWDDKTTGAKRSKIKVVIEQVTFIGSAPGARTDDDTPPASNFRGGGIPERDGDPPARRAPADKPSRSAREAEADVGRFADDEPPF
jgi:single-strand DNA-binding protein